MTTSSHTDGQSDSHGVSLAEGDPYRTPPEVPVDPKRGWMKSPLTWIAAAGLLAALLVAFAHARRSTGQIAPEYVQEFGYTRSGPPIEEIDVGND